MRTITHSDLRNGSAQILREAEAGETMLVTNRGRTVAMIGPPTAPETGGPRLIRAGQPDAIATLRRHDRSTPTQAIIDELRGDH